MGDPTLVVAVWGAVTGTVGTLVGVVQIWRDRPRLEVRLGASAVVGSHPVAWIEVLNAGHRATTVREIGLHAGRVKFTGPKEAMEGQGDATFKFGEGTFIDAGSSQRFEGVPNIDTFGLPVDLPLRAYAVDLRGRRVWGSALPIVRLIVGEDPPFSPEDSAEFRRLFDRPAKPLLPAAVEPRWKVWKRAELRNPSKWSASGRFQ